MKSRKKPLFVSLILLLALLVGCGGDLTPTPDLVATQIAVEKAAHATMTAEVPTAADTPMPSATEANTPEPTATKTNTPEPTDTPVPTIEPFEVWRETANSEITYYMVDKSDAYIGERVCWHGEIFNIKEESGSTFFQAWYEDFTGDAFVVVYNGVLPDVFTEDVVEACGYIDEKYEGTNRMGATIIQPQIRAVHVEHYNPPAQPPAQPQPTKPPTPTPRLAQMGEQVKAGNWLFTVTEVQWHKTVYLYDDARVAMGAYCVIFMDIQNQASGTTHFGELWWELRGAQGAVFDDDSASFRASWQFGGKDTAFDDLNPGQTAQIVMAFDVAQGAKGLQLYSYKLDQPFVLIGDAQPAQDQ